jgi:hypothetical protein
MAVTIKKAEYNLKLVGSYCRDRCYAAAERTTFNLYKDIISDIAKLKDWDDKKIQHYIRICQMVKDL